MKRFVSVMLSFVLLALFSGCSEKRPPAPKAGTPVVLPWGAVDTESQRPVGVDPDLDASIGRGLQTHKDHNDSAYRVLVLSGGGSRGAYGAGVLSGWSRSGKRPVFDVVTGISTGALIATYAFLGSQYDEGLQAYVNVDADDIYTPRSRLYAMLYDDAIFDTAPLRRIIERQITPEVLDAVAREYRRGRRLFVGTTNLDAERFTVWDMGAIAASKRPDRLERYRDVLLASAAMPILFPPVYFDTGEGFSEMHVDGGMTRTLFYYDYVGKLTRQAKEKGIDIKNKAVYVLLNGKRFNPRRYIAAVEPKVGSISAMTLSTLIDENYLSSLYRIEVEASLYDAAFYRTEIPEDYNLSGNSFVFDRKQMRALYDLGVTRGKNGSAWERERTDSEALKR